MKNKYEFYEISIVKSHKRELGNINGLEGIIYGMSQNEETGKWGYAVWLYQKEEVWDILEEDLQPTGKKSDPKGFYTGGRIRVSVDPKTGEGEVIGD